MQPLHEALAELPGAVRADVFENESEYVFVIDIPGASPDQTDIQFEGNRIRIEAARDEDLPEDSTFVVRNRSPSFIIVFPLPPDASDSMGSAELERGVLELRVSKRSETPDAVIPVQQS